MNAELPALKLDSARFRTVVAEAPLGATGADQVRFEIATNAGTDFGPLTKIASGGELSRFILALKVALEGKSREMFPPVTQLPGRDAVTAFDGSEYQI